MDYLRELRADPEHALQSVSNSNTRLLLEILAAVPHEHAQAAPTRGYQIKKWLVSWGQWQRSGSKGLPPGADELSDSQGSRPVLPRGEDRRAPQIQPLTRTYERGVDYKQGHDDLWDTRRNRDGAPRESSAEQSRRARETPIDGGMCARRLPYAPGRVGGKTSRADGFVNERGVEGAQSGGRGRYREDFESRDSDRMGVARHAAAGSAGAQGQGLGYSVSASTGGVWSTATLKDALGPKIASKALARHLAPGNASDFWVALPARRLTHAESFSAYISSTLRAAPLHQQLLLLPLRAWDEERLALIDAAASFATLFLGRRVAVREPLSAGETRYLGSRCGERGDEVNADDILNLLSRKGGGVLVCVTLSALFGSHVSNDQSAWLTDEQNALGVMSFAAAFADRPGRAIGLRRLCVILVSELCRHVLGMSYCLWYRCLLNNQHVDDLTLVLCPVCLRKLHVATNGFDVPRRYEAMLAWLNKHDIGPDPTAAWLEDRLQAITA